MADSAAVKGQLAGHAVRWRHMGRERNRTSGCPQGSGLRDSTNAAAVYFGGEIYGRGRWVKQGHEELNSGHAWAEVYRTPTGAQQVVCHAQS